MAYCQPSPVGCLGRYRDPEYAERSCGVRYDASGGHSASGVDVIGLRGLHGWQRRPGWSLGLVARSPELAASVLFAGATVTELSQAYWPTRLFLGRFDVFDILAFAVGIGACYAVG